MGRYPRNDAAGQFFHVVARGNKKQTLFFAEQDYSKYLALLAAAAQELQIRVFRFALMPNHVHLLISPNRSGAMGKALHAIQRGYALWFQEKTGEEGAVWQGRYWSSHIQSDQYLLACGRYIELNPVRARIAGHPAAYRWSSAAHYLGKQHLHWLAWDPGFLSLGESWAARQIEYERFLLVQNPLQSKPETLGWSFWAKRRIA